MTTQTEHHSHHHIMPVRTYLLVFAGLMVLLAITVTVGYIDFGPLNKVVTITVATIKAGLIMTYFMHLIHSKKLTWLFAGLGFFFLIIMLLITLSDYAARGTIQGPFGPAA